MPLGVVRPDTKQRVFNPSAVSLFMIMKDNNLVPYCFLYDNNETESWDMTTCHKQTLRMMLQKAATLIVNSAENSYSVMQRNSGFLGLQRTFSYWLY